MGPTASPTPEDDFGLMEAVALRDQRALASLYDRHSGAVFGLCLRILRERSEAEEATCDVFSEVWNRSSRFDRERGHPLAYLLNLARSRAIDRLRSRGRRDRIFAVRDEQETHDAPSPASPLGDTM